MPSSISNILFSTPSLRTEECFSWEVARLLASLFHFLSLSNSYSSCCSSAISFGDQSSLTIIRDTVTITLPILLQVLRKRIFSLNSNVQLIFCSKEGRLFHLSAVPAHDLIYTSKPMFTRDRPGVHFVSSPLLPSNKNKNQINIKN